MTLPLAEIARKYREGATMPQIASEFGVSHPAIARRLVAAGEPIRPKNFPTSLFRTLAEFDRLDALSRKRSLTNEESLALEAAMRKLIKGRRWIQGFELARRGLLRDRRARSNP